MNGLLQDVRYALRQMRKNRGFAASAVLVLALGIGATTGMLAIVQSVLLRPFAYRQPDRLVMLGETEEQDETFAVLKIADFPEMQRNLHQFEQLAALNALPVPVETEDGTDMQLAPEVGTNFFQTLGVVPEMGRPFREGDDAPGAGAAIVSHEFWQTTLHGKHDILGSTIKVNGHVYTIVGVMPPGFQFPVTNGKTVWTAIQLTPEHKTRQGFDNFQALGRLKPGATLEQARAEGEAFLQNRKSSSGPVLHFWVYPYQERETRDAKPGLLALLAACVVLLLIAVVNSANLQIARATVRQNEVAMRAALGATRARIVRQAIVESLTLASAGATLGWLLAIGMVTTARNLFPHQARFDALRLDPWTFGACLLLTLLCGVVTALAPSWHVVRRGRQLPVQASTAGRMSRRNRFIGWLVAAEVALSTLLLVAAGLLLQTFRSLENVPLGFSPERVTTFLLWPAGGNTIAMPLKVSAYQRILDRLEQLPNVEAAGLITSLPISNFQMITESGFGIPGILPSDQKPAPTVRITAVSPDYFRALEIPISMGRALSANDAAAAQLVGIVNHAFVTKYLPNKNPVGQQLVLDKPSGFRQPITIVGVSGDVIQTNDVGAEVAPELELSYLQLPPSADFSQYMIGFSDGFAVRTRLNDANMASTIRSIVKSEAPGFAIDNLLPFPQAVHDNLKTQRLAFEITSSFAWIAILLSAAGIYAVLAYVVGQRVHEMGIRLALGATRGNVFSLILRQGVWMVGVGLLGGWLAALFSGRWIQSFLFGVTVRDPITYLLVGIVVGLASAVAVLVPAMRAARVEPMVALRYE